MSKFNKTLMMVSLIGATALLGACSGTDGTKGDAALGTKEGNATAAPKEPIDLVIQNENFGWTQEFFMENYGDDIKRKFPHINVIHIARGTKTIKEVVISGQQVDIIASPLGSFYKNIKELEVNYDITPLIKKYNYDLNRLDPSVVGLSKQLAGGGIYDIPTSMSPAALVYNKDLFDKFGIPYPKDGMTWDDTFALAQKMTRQDSGVQYRGLYASIGHLVNRNQLSLNFINPTTKKADFENGKWKSFLENMIRFYQIPGYGIDAKLASLTPQKTEWEKAQTVAMWLPVSGAHLIPEMKNYDFATFPIFKEYPDVGPQAYPVSFYITSMSKHKDAAFEVLAYLTSDEYQMIQSKRGYFTVLKNDAIKAAFGQDATDYKGKNFRALVPKIQAPNSIETEFSADASTALTTAFYDVVLGKTDINSSLRTAAEKIDKLMEAAQLTAGAKK